MTGLQDLLEETPPATWAPAPVVQRQVIVHDHILDVPMYLDDAVATVGPLGHLFIWRWSTFQLRPGHPARFPVKVFAPGQWNSFDHKGPAFDLPTEYPDHNPAPAAVPAAPASRPDPQPEHPAPADPFEQLSEDRLEQEHGDINRKTDWSTAANPDQSERVRPRQPEPTDPSTPTALMPVVRDDDDRAYQTAEGSRRHAGTEDPDDGGWRPATRGPRVSPKTRERARTAARGLRDRTGARRPSWTRLQPSGLPSVQTMGAAGLFGFVVLWFTLSQILH